VSWWKRKTSKPHNKDDTDNVSEVERVTRATVTTLVQEKKGRNGHGPYFIADGGEYGSVTCSLNPSVWQDKEEPVVGEVVVLSKLYLKPAGWRAGHGRRARLSDQAMSNQQTAIRNE
jgi:hypothetical protein